MGVLVDGCAICNGMGQVAAGASCPVCGGTGVASAGQAQAHRQVLVDAAVAAAAERFRQAGTAAADKVLRDLAQARADAQETQARAGEVLSALLEVRRQVWVAQQAALRVRGAELLITRAEAAASAVAGRLDAPVMLASDPTDPPPGITLPAGMGGEIFYLDSLLVRQLDVWGPANVPNFVGPGAPTPITTLGDLIVGGPGGVAQRLGIGSVNQVLTVVAGTAAWANNPAGFANPMTTAGDLLFENATPAPARLAIGTAGQVLTVAGGLPSWANAPSGFANPMTTKGDLIVADTGGVALRLALGAAGQVLTVAGGTVIWQTNPAGFANPMTTAGDLIIATAGGAAARLGVGMAGQVLTVAGGTPKWQTISTTLGTPLAGPSPSQQTVWLQADGSIVVLPLSYWGLSGDDSTWINTAFTFLPTITGGSSQYGGTYTGPWIVGTVKLLPADYQIQTGIVFPLNSGSTIHLHGHGAGTRLFGSSGVTVIARHGAAGGPQGGFPALQAVRGEIRGLRIDGSNGAAVGIDWGGGWGGIIDDVAIVNFSAAAAIGLHVNNSASGEWTEKTRFDVHLLHCTQAVVIENSSGSTSNTPDSCEYNDWTFYIMADSTSSPAQSGVTLKGGAYLSGGSLKIRGNFPAFSGPVLLITGQDGNGNWSQIYHEFIDITVESNTGLNIPQTVSFGNANNTFRNCNGLMTFQFTTWTQSNAAPGQFTFKGLVEGDLSLLQSCAQVVTPAVPAASTPQTNNTNADVIVYVNGGTGVAVSVNGQATGQSSGSFRVPAQGQINLGAYTVSPTWTWVGTN